MELIERYLQEIGRNLPRNQRADILSELRSALMDTLDARGDDPSEEAIVQVIKEMGAPEKVAASYHPQGQYLIGPALYPTFKLVLGIVFTAVTGAQLLAMVIALSLEHEAVSFFNEFAGIINSLPAALGMVVIVFALLERYGVRTDREETVFDPRKLPQLETDQPIKRGEQIFSIIVAVVVLALLTQFAIGGGFLMRGVFENPVINQYFFWIALSMMASIVVDIWLLWKGHWQMSTRLAKIGSDVVSMAVLFVLIQGHNAWLAERGVTGLFNTLEQLSVVTPQIEQTIGMAAFRMGLSIAFIVTAVDTLVQTYRIIKAGLKGSELRQMGVAEEIR
ncbi:MAG: hypothetical protein H6636_08170 [Anaerolineales bacterium]|nr:hypothetical protein [Anaerolineales bacterium]